jgi:hypothetical protein
LRPKEEEEEVAENWWQKDEAVDRGRTLASSFFCHPSFCHPG